MNYQLKSTKGMKIKHPPILGHGAQGTVFKIGKNSALKLFNGYWYTVKNRPNDLEVARRMTSLELTHFLKPTRLIVNKKGLRGVETPIIKRGKKKLIDMNIKKIIDNLKALRKDAAILSDNGIRLNDFNYDSVYISGDNITIGDFSYFLLDDTQDLHKLNDSALDVLFATDMVYGDYNYRNTVMLYENLYSQMRGRHFEDVLEDISSKGCKTIRQYIKSLHR